MRIALINGPNLNLLGQREPELYGRETLQDLENGARRHAQSLGIEIECYQSNNEGQLIDALHRARLRCQGVVFNPAGYTHTSVALRDAIIAISIPVVEVHLSNPHKREEFRQTMLTTGACVGQVSGLGVVGYELAITALAKLLKAGVVVRAAPVAAVVAPAAPAPASSSGEREGREARGFEDGRGKRRGRRGGRGRRRDGEGFDGEGKEEGSEEGRAEGAPVEDIQAKYANLRGATVRRGSDVLAEGEDAPDTGPESPGGLLVKFSDAPEEPQTAHLSSPSRFGSGGRQPSGAESKARPEPSARPESVRRPEPLYGRSWRSEAEPKPAAGGETAKAIAEKTAAGEALESAGLGLEIEEEAGSQSKRPARKKSAAKAGAKKEPKKSVAKPKKAAKKS